MMQSRYHSVIEACTNTAIGYGINFFGQLVIFPMVGIKASVGQNIKVGLLFTCISVARQYVIRRWFTRKTEA
jgi:hypothetical protein